MYRLKQFQSEAEMQSWLLGKLQNAYIDGLADLITNEDYLKNFRPKCIEHYIILDSFNSCFESLRVTQLLSVDKNISLDKPDVLRPDLLLYSSDT